MKTLSPLFPLGQTVITPSCLSEILSCNETPSLYFHRHQCGEWGDLGAEDKAENEFSLKHGERLLSAYVLPNGKRIYCVSEWNRSVSTLLLVTEY